MKAIKRIFFATIIVIVIIVLASIIAIKQKSQAPLQSSNTIVKPTTPPQEPLARTYSIQIENKKLISKPQTLGVYQNDGVTLSITSNEAEKFVIKGYNQSVDLSPNTPAQLQFTATNTGKFILELENSQNQIGFLQVNSR